MFSSTSTKHPGRTDFVTYAIENVNLRCLGNKAPEGIGVMWSSTTSNTVFFGVAYAGLETNPSHITLGGPFNNEF